jgi:hypothetical protein
MNTGEQRRADIPVRNRPSGAGWKTRPPVIALPFVYADEVHASIPHNPLLAEPMYLTKYIGLIEPTSRLQKYRLTEKGRTLLAQLKREGGGA